MACCPKVIRVSSGGGGAGGGGGGIVPLTPLPSPSQSGGGVLCLRISSSILAEIPCLCHGGSINYIADTPTIK